MSRYLSLIDDDASEMQKAIILDGLCKRFPEISFECRRGGPLDMSNAIMPLLGQPHPTKPEVTIMEWPDERVTQEIQYAFQSLLTEARARKTS